MLDRIYPYFYGMFRFLAGMYLISFLMSFCHKFSISKGDVVKSILIKVDIGQKGNDEIFSFSNLFTTVYDVGL